MQCPFCLKDYGKPLGAIFLATARDWEKSDATAGEKACNACLALMAQLLDAWHDGGINSFMERARSAGVLKEKFEYVESGTRSLG